MENNVQKQPEPQVKSEKRPNETNAVNVDAFLKIFDPKTRKVFVEQQA
jgi:hypothetical protein